jgi:hypothetical protein
MHTVGAIIENKMMRDLDIVLEQYFRKLDSEMSRKL